MFGLNSKSVPLLCFLLFCFHDVLGRKMRLPKGLEKDDIIEWRGDIPKEKGESTLEIRVSRRKLFRLVLQPYRRKMVISIFDRKIVVTNVGKIAPGKSFNLQIRIGTNITIYINRNFQRTISLKDGLRARIRFVKTSGSVKTTHLKKLTTKDFADRLNEDACGQSEDEEELEEDLNKICQLDKISDEKLARIVGGKAANPTSNPWQAAIRRKDTYINENDNPLLCGASLINECWAVSAAHCFPVTHAIELNKIVLRVGDYFNNDTDKDNNKQFSAHEDVQDLSIEKVFKHKGYKRAHQSNDIALIKLKNPCANVGRFVKPVCLPTSSDQYLNGGKCIISGWGAAAYGQEKKKFPNCLQQAGVYINTTATCERVYKGTVYNNDVMLCAGGIGGADACQGDSGGPLVCSDNKERHTLVGLTSWGVECGHETRPGVYTRLSSFMKWMYIQINFEYKNK